MIDGIIAIVIAYLLGSIPVAYIVTRFLTGADIRHLGGGNVGALNVFREVGLRAAIPVAFFDVGKGVAAVAIAHWVLEVPPLFVLLVGLAVVAGHMWSVFLKFTGGNGLATTMGALSLLMTRELLIVLVIMLIVTIFIRNPVMSLDIGLLSLPVSAWLLGKSGLYIIFSIVLIVMLALHFLPTVRAALVKAGSRENLVAELLRRDRVK